MQFTTDSQEEIQHLMATTLCWFRRQPEHHKKMHLNEIYRESVEERSYLAASLNSQFQFDLEP